MFDLRFSRFDYRIKNIDFKNLEFLEFLEFLKCLEFLEFLEFLEC